MIFGGEPSDRDACGDRSLLAGGVASIVTVRTPCERALRVADRWLAGTSAGRPPRTIGGFRCDAALHSFDQELVQCDHRGRRKGAAFVHRRS